MLRQRTKNYQFWLGLQGSYIKGSVIGCNTFVGNGCHIEDTLLMGNDNYSNDRERERARSQGLSVLGIGELIAATSPPFPPGPLLLLGRRSMHAAEQRTYHGLSQLVC